MFSRAELYNILSIPALFSVMAMGIFYYNAGAYYPWGGADFARAYSVSEMLREGHSTEIYDTTIFLKKVATYIKIPAAHLTGWLYSPVYSVLLQPLAYLPYKTAFFVYSIFQVGVFFAAGYGFLWRHSYMTIMLFSSAFYETLFWGQNSVFVAALYISVFRWIDKNHILAGVALGIAIIKPQMGVLVPVILLVGRYYMTSIAAFVTIAALTVLSIAWNGLYPWAGYLHAMQWVTSDKHVTLSALDAAVVCGMPSVYTFFYYINAPELWCKIAQVIATIGCVVILVYTRNVWKQDSRIALLYLSILTLFATPYLGIYDYVLAVTMILTIFLTVTTHTRFGYDMIFTLLPLSFVAFIHEFILEKERIVTAPLIILLAGIYLWKNKRLRFESAITV